MDMVDYIFQLHILFYSLLVQTLVALHDRAEFIGSIDGLNN